MRGIARFRGVPLSGKMVIVLVIPVIMIVMMLVVLMMILVASGFLRLHLLAVVISSILFSEMHSHPRILRTSDEMLFCRLSGILYDFQMHFTAG